MPEHAKKTKQEHHEEHHEEHHHEHEEKIATKKEHKKGPSAQTLAAGIKTFAQKGAALEMELIANPELYDTDAMNKKVKEWKKSIKAFKNENEHYLEKSQYKVLKMLKKKADYLGD